jgi:hypothetical protein
LCGHCDDEKRKSQESDRELSFHGGIIPASIVATTPICDLTATSLC